MCEGHHHGEGCGCGQHGGHGYFRRRFRSRAEQIAELEEYLKELEAEAQGVREALEALRSAPPSPQP